MSIKKQRRQLLVALGVGALLAVPAVVDGQGPGPGPTATFTGCIEFIRHFPMESQGRLQTRVYLQIRDRETGESIPFGFYRNGIRARDGGGTSLNTDVFWQEIEPVLAQLREAARDRLHVAMQYDSVTGMVWNFLVQYERPCD